MPKRAKERDLSFSFRNLCFSHLFPAFYGSSARRLLRAPCTLATTSGIRHFLWKIPRLQKRAVPSKSRQGRVNSNLLLVLEIVFLFRLESRLATWPQDGVRDTTRSGDPDIPSLLYQRKGGNPRGAEKETRQTAKHSTVFRLPLRKGLKRFSSQILWRSFYGSNLKGNEQFAHLPFPISRPSVGTTFHKELIH